MISNSKPHNAAENLSLVRVTVAKCPRCGKPIVPRFRPFCSERCSDLDLAGWLTGRYRIPTDEMADPNDLNIKPDEKD
ncbi:MAG: DNA gyrase inhibitor YacG [Rhodospirillaceae bacterium]